MDRTDLASAIAQVSRLEGEFRLRSGARSTQYFDKYQLSKSGVAMVDNRAVKGKLGFSDAQKFSRAMTDAVTRVASTSVGDDCGEGFEPPSEWANVFAGMAADGGSR